ncbi:MAG: patatin-like phospholipase family protein [Bacteroidales bacterium]|nr:patatin-like phospholipase family protein [Bacteroidales bacterium]
MKKNIIFYTLTLCLMLASGRADVCAQQEGRPKIGVVLGGGGAKGAAHIGALKYLEEQGIPVDYVAGTSMGSIIGGLYAQGYTPDEMAKIISTLDWSHYMTRRIEPTMLTSKERLFRSTYLFQIPFRMRNVETAISEDQNLWTTIIQSLPSSFVGGSNVTNLFNNMSVGYQDSISFDSLPIPFACVATDIVTGDAYVMRSGRLPVSMRASMAIPGIFDPVQIGNHLLLDGGMVNNFPTDICREMGADIIIGIEVAQELDSTYENLQSLPQIAYQMMQIAVSHKRQDNRQLCDIYIRPDMSGFNMLSFTKEAIDTLVMRGYLQAQACAPQIEELKRELAAYGGTEVKKVTPPAKYLGDDTIYITHVERTGVATDYERQFERCGLTPGLMTNDDIEDALQRLIGTGTLTDITYNLTESQCPTDSMRYACYKMTTNLKNAEPHVFAAGLRYNSEESASVLLALGLNQHRGSGFKLMTSARLNYNTRFHVRGSYEGWRLGTINMEYLYHKNNYQIYDHRSLMGTGLRRENKLKLFFSEFQSQKVNISLGGQEEIIDFAQAISGPEIPSYDFTRKYYGLFGRISYDSRNKKFMATRGVQVLLDINWRTQHRSHFKPTGYGFGDLTFSIRRNHAYGGSRFTGSPQFYTRLTSNHGHESAFHTLFGGPIANRYGEWHLPFIGINHVQMCLTDAAVVRYDLRFRVSNSQYISILANAIGGSTEPIFTIEDSKPLKAYYGIGFQYALPTILGLVAVDLHWSSLNYQWGASVSIGYDI